VISFLVYIYIFKDFEKRLRLGVAVYNHNTERKTSPTFRACRIMEHIPGQQMGRIQITA
jgi:hypothetical protein